MSIEDGSVLMVWTQPHETTSFDEGTRSINKGIGAAVSEKAGAVLRKIPVVQLQANLHSVCTSMVEVLKDIKEVGGFQLAEVTLQVEVGAEGGIELIGTSKVSGSGAISLTFKRP